ncbi:unnamed protein product [Didymodactylos carnosus]|uniref:Uncharacterized protein n=1 Tax=Didymodactylos carnosus TaxID=1234261 RepID=A0A815M887_9BILA|nr:unnamed protein product [Didymodactylos carnosus]CAF1414506.1 unnamed protein product [Didymodactylos carnosus]CAF3802979.1 unnamed protein product [Didymodactylos carnosus]CAF4301204.1 unnamed protein product [Didymodactylos carnosus]
MYSTFIIVFVITASIISYSTAASTGKDSCPFPSSLKSNYDFNYNSRPNEWKNLNSKTSFFLLALSWTNTYCDGLSAANRAKVFQCTHYMDNLIVHGFWPQAKQAANVQAHPRNCRNEKQLNTTFVKRYYCIMPDEDLMQAEWEKHGKTSNSKMIIDPFNLKTSLC